MSATNVMTTMLTAIGLESTTRMSLFTVKSTKNAEMHTNKSTPIGSNSPTYGRVAVTKLSSIRSILRMLSSELAYENRR
jgi:hypothetical protein